MRKTLIRGVLLNIVLAAGLLAAPGNGKGNGNGGKKEPPPPPPPPPECNVTYDGYVTRIAFSGYVWAVKDHGRSLAGPGPNRFSDSSGSGSVWVDDDGRLHLKIRKIKNKWHAAEVINLCTLGYGTYRIYLDGEVDALDPNVVLGIFTWSDQPAENHRELDIEFSRWADPNNLNAQYVVQPYHLPENMFRFAQPPATPRSTHSLNWTAGQAALESRVGDGAEGPLISSYTFTQGVPTTLDENFRFNLWMFQGNPPSDGQAVEIIINRFEFEPTP